MYAQLLLLCRGLAMLLAASFIAFLVGRFKQLTKRRDIPSLWMLYWLFFFAQYAISIASTATHIRDTYASLLGRILADVAQSVCLLLIAESLPIRQVAQPRTRVLSRFATIVILIIGVAVAIIGTVNPWGRPIDVATSILGCVTLSWFAVRWVTFNVPDRRLFIGILLFIYAAD